MNLSRQALEVIASKGYKVKSEDFSGTDKEWFDELVAARERRSRSRENCAKCEESIRKRGHVCPEHFHDYTLCRRSDCFCCAIEVVLVDQAPDLHEKIEWGSQF